MNPLQLLRMQWKRMPITTTAGAFGLWQKSFILGWENAFFKIINNYIYHLKNRTCFKVAAKNSCRRKPKTAPPKDASRRVKGLGKCWTPEAGVPAPVRALTRRRTRPLVPNSGPLHVTIRER